MKRYIKKSYTLCLNALLAILLISGAVPAAYAASCAVPAPSYGKDVLAVSIPTSTTYYLWVRMEVPATSATSVLLQVDTASCFNMGGSSGAAVNSWQWVNYQNGATGSAISTSLSQGNHTITLLGNAPAIKVDRIEFLADKTCVPSGTGDNCTQTSISQSSPSAPSSSSMPSSSSSASVSSHITSNSSGSVGTNQVPTDNGTTVTAVAPLSFQPVTDAADGAITKAQYYLNGTLVATVAAAPFAYHLDTTNLLNGTYTFTTDLYYTSGTMTVSTQHLIVRNPMGLKQVMLLLRAYILPIVVVLLMLGGVVVFRLRRIRYLRRYHMQPTSTNEDWARMQAAARQGYVAPYSDPNVTPQIISSDMHGTAASLPYAGQHPAAEAGYQQGNVSEQGSRQDSTGQGVQQ